MVDNNYSVIKPVENLQHIESLNSANRRQRRKKKQNPNEHEDKHQSDENELNSSIEEGLESQIAENDRNENSIDYRA